VDRLRRFGEPGPAQADPPWDWLPAAVSAFQDRLLDAEAYPCDFGVRAQRAGHNSLTALDSRLPGRWGVAALAGTLRVFAGRAAHGPPRQSLVVFCGPPEPAPATLAEHRDRFWALLGALAAHDERPWPPDRPRDPADPHWQWCFHGEPWFAFALSPAYRARRSRRVGTCLTVVFQTSRVFQGLGGSTPAGCRAKRRIRERLVRYDGTPPHPHLGEADHSSTHKWRQYVLPDDDRLSPPDRCPIGPEPRTRPGG
jgi:FPC/CPF motif-containing protein YcgG